MTPLYLKLKGIYSYQKEQIIDFTKFIDANLFGIFGHVGSGKSAILEAITFALYGETERLNQKENRNYNLMNLSSNELFIEFVFSAGKDAKEYKFVVNGHRNKNHFDKIDKFDRSVYKKENGEWTPLEQGNAEKIIGLSYDNFKRTIIIPQGKFQDFLHLKDADRTEMLKEIFQLDRFDLSSKVKALWGQNNKEAQRVIGNLEQIGEVSEQSIKEVEKELKAFSKQKKDISAALKGQEKKLAEFNKLEEIFKRLKDAEKKQEELIKREKEYSEKEEALKEYEVCKWNFFDILSQKKERETMLARLQNQLDEKKNSFLELKKTLAENEAGFSELKARYEKKEELQHCVVELKDLLDVKKIEKEIFALENSIKLEDKNMLLFEEKSGVFKKEKEEKLEFLKNIKDKRAAFPSSLEFNEIIKWYQKHGLIKEQLCTIQKKKEDIESAIALEEEQKANLFSDETIDLDISNKSCKKIIELLEQEESKISENLRTLDEKMKELQVSNKLHEFIVKLKEGAPCPLCGSVTHPAPLVLEDVQEEINNDQKEMHGFHTKKDLLKDVINKLKTIDVKLDEKGKHLESLEKELSEVNAELAAHLSNFTWQAYNYSSEDESKAKKDFEDACAIDNKIEEITRSLELLEQQFAEFSANRESLQSRISQAKEQLSVKKAEQQTYIKKLKTFDYKDYEAKEEAVIAKEIEELGLIYSELVDNYGNKERQITSLNDSINRLEGEIKGHEANLKSNSDLLEKDLSEIAKRLKNFGFSNLEEVQCILQKEIDIDNEKREIKSYQEALHAVNESYKGLLVESEGKEYNFEEHEQLKQKIVLSKEAAEKLTEQIATIEFTKNQMQKNLDAKLELEEKKRVLDEKAGNISKLSSLFRSNGFVNYVSSIYLQNLCETANKRFHRLTRQQLQLELSEGNSFNIRDFLNNGNVRNVKTLSGGQTFQASLCLALALAENINQIIGAKQNFFFLDEGFGTLDKDSLQLVFDTLKSLRKEGRVVGVISHLDELKQEIDVFLQVKNDESNGSQITSSVE